MKTCDQRNDKWAEEVRMRVLDRHDLVAPESHYNITCIESFLLNKDRKSSNATTVGWLVCNIAQENFDILCEWLESERSLMSKIRDQRSDV